MAVTLKNTSVGTFTAATETDVYTNSSGVAAIVLSSTITCINAAGMTGEMKLTDGSNNMKEWIIPPLSSIGYNNGLVETKKIVVPNGYKIRAKVSLTLSSYDNGGVSINYAEGASSA